MPRAEKPPPDSAPAAAPQSRPRSNGHDPDQLERLERLYVAVVSDALDQLGIRSNVMAPHIRPLDAESKVAGFAATVHLVEADGAPPDRSDWYRGEIEALEQMEPGDVMVGSTCQASYWGELLATASARRGVRGVIADAYTRDTRALMRMGFPTFVAGINPQDSLGRVDVDGYAVPIECGGVRLEQGDLVLADHDGVVVVPADLAVEVLERAETKVAAEGEMRAQLRAGMSLAEAFAIYGTL